VIDERAVMAALAQLEAQVASLRNQNEEPKDGAVETPVIDVPVGGVIAWAGGTAAIPGGWLTCDGTAYSSTNYPGLFAAIGYTFGGADGTFNVPNLKGRRIAGYNASDTAYDQIGETGGTDTAHSHSVSVGDHAAHKHDMGNHTHDGPDHTHSLADHGHLMNITYGDFTPTGTAAVADAEVVGSGILTTGNQSAKTTGYPSTNDTSELAAMTHSASSGTAAHLDPYMVMSWIIKAF
jgi:microcystin-dependent protein